MGVTVADRERMGRWFEELTQHVARQPDQMRIYETVRSWAYSRWMSEARQAAGNGRAQMDYVLSAHWLELGPPKPAVVLPQAAPRKPATPRPLIHRSTERWALLFLGGLVAFAVVIAFQAGRTGAIEQVRACYRSTTPLGAQTACPVWALPPKGQP